MFSLFSNVVFFEASIRENICFYFIPLTGTLNICNLHEKKLQQSYWGSFRCEEREKVLQMKMMEATLLGKQSAQNGSKESPRPCLPQQILTGGQDKTEAG